MDMNEVSTPLDQFNNTLWFVCFKDIIKKIRIRGITIENWFAEFSGDETKINCFDFLSYANITEFTYINILVMGRFTNELISNIQFKSMISKLRYVFITA